MTDLISRSAVLDILSNEFDMAAEERAEADNEKDRAFNAGEIHCARHSKRKVKELPAIDAVPVVHARWAGVMWCYRCTNCGAYGPDDGGHKTKFCPDCGARMDGEADG